jgi:hypothetical protein
MSSYPTSVWDGTSTTRPTASVHRAPDAGDWRTLVAEVIALQTQLQPLGIGATGAIPTSDPSVAGRLWADTAVVKVSAG